MKIARVDVVTDRDLETLGELEAANKNLGEVGHHAHGWAKPMDLGAWNGSHHSKTLQKLARLGFVAMSRQVRPAVNSRPGIRYKITAAGIERLAQSRLANRSSKR